jgi:hypothetical protein
VRFWSPTPRIGRAADRRGRARCARHRGGCYPGSAPLAPSVAQQSPARGSPTLRRRSRRHVHPTPPTCHVTNRWAGEEWLRRIPRRAVTLGATVGRPDRLDFPERTLALQLECKLRNMMPDQTVFVDLDKTAATNNPAAASPLSKHPVRRVPSTHHRRWAAHQNQVVEYAPASSSIRRSLRLLVWGRVVRIDPVCRRRSRRCGPATGCARGVVRRRCSVPLWARRGAAGSTLGCRFWQSTGGFPQPTM